MSYQLYIFPTPLSALCELRHDTGGYTLTATPTVHPTGRPGQVFTIPDNTPQDNGCALALSAANYFPLSIRSVLHVGAETYLRTDDFHLTPKAAVSTLDRLVPDGVSFRNYVWAMMTGFCDYQLWLTNRRDQLFAVWKQANELGANGRRVLGQMAYITAFDPRAFGQAYYDELQPFAHAAAQHGLRLHFDVFADNQVYNLGIEHWARTCDQLRPVESVLIGLGNEWPKNGFDPNAFPYPGVISSQGSTTSDAAPPMPGWGVRCFHGRRDYPKVFMSFDDAVYVGRGLDASANQYAPVAPVVHDEPMGFAEVDIPNRRSTDPVLAQCLMLTGKAYGAGATFHCEDGIFSRLLGPTQQTCARAFFDAS